MLGVSFGKVTRSRFGFVPDGRRRRDVRSLARVVDENDDDDHAICKRFCKQHHDDVVVEKRAWASGDTGTSGDDDDDAGGGELWVSGVFPARGGGTHGTGGG